MFQLNYCVRLLTIFLWICPLGRPQKLFVVSITLLDKSYHDDYKDLNSPRSRGLIQEMTFIIVLFCRRTFPLFVGINIKQIFKGSVGLDFDMIFEPSANSTNSTIVEKFTEANGTKELQFVVLGKATAVDNTPVILSPNATAATTTAFAPDTPTTGKSRLIYAD